MFLKIKQDLSCFKDKINHFTIVNNYKKNVIAIFLGVQKNNFIRIYFTNKQSYDELDDYHHQITLRFVPKLSIGRSIIS